MHPLRCHSYNFQIVKDRTGERRTTRLGHILPICQFSPRQSVERRGANGQRPARHCILSCLTSLWPLAVALPPVSRGPFGGNAKYNGFGKPCQTLQERFYACRVGRQGAFSTIFYSALEADFGAIWAKMAPTPLQPATARHVSPAKPLWPRPALPTPGRQPEKSAGCRATYPEGHRQ